MLESLAPVAHSSDQRSGDSNAAAEDASRIHLLLLLLPVHGYFQDSLVSSSSLESFRGDRLEHEKFKRF